LADGHSKPPSTEKVKPSVTTAEHLKTTAAKLSLRGALATKQSSLSKTGAPGLWIASHIVRRVAPPAGSQ
jgi:hypothetical protein